MLELYWLYLNIKIWFIFFSDPKFALECL
jgi:hypothetical protein